MRALLFAATLATVTYGCGGGGTPPPPARQPTPLDLATTGTISGSVRLDGVPPAMQPIRFGSFAECAAAHPGPVSIGDALVSDGRVENAFVYLSDGLGDRVFAIPEQPVEMDQKGCLFAPRVLGAQVGQLIAFVNSDRTVHNVHGRLQGASGWNFILSRQGASSQVRIDHPEIMLSVRCDLHPWMQGWIGVVDHPYFAVTGADGSFTLPNVPPGTYTVTAWHERFGTTSQQVSLAARGAGEATLTFTAP